MKLNFDKPVNVIYKLLKLYNFREVNALIVCKRIPHLHRSLNKLNVRNVKIKRA